MSEPMTDEELRQRIMDERDPRELAMLVGTYYHNRDRAEATSTQLTWFHLGMLTAAIIKLTDPS